MKIVICGGHLTPAISIIEELRADTDIYYFGRKNALEGDSGLSFEYQSISETGVHFIDLRTGRFQRKFTKHTIPSLFKIPGGFINAFSELLKIRPNIVVGFGGYVSVPICLAAKILNIPIIIHEQTFEAGAANKVISAFANKICISFESSKKYFPENKIIVTGNPIRRALFDPTNVFSLKIKKPTIYITGGSLGSHAINKLVMDSLPVLLQKYSIIHQAGSSEEFKDFEKLTEIKDKLSGDLKEKYILSKFFKAEEVGEIYKISDLVVGRSGINTISELVVFEKPTLLIPLLVSQKNEQFKNASFFEKLGLGEIASQENLSSGSFIQKIDMMMQRLDKYKLIKSNNYFSKDSAKKIVKVIYASSKNHN